MTLWRNLCESSLFKRSSLNVTQHWGRCRLLTSWPASTRIAELCGHNAMYYANTELRVNGFVRSIRKQKKIAFAMLGDGSCLSTIQVVMSSLHAERLTNGIAISIKGHWVASQGRSQSHELQVSEIEVLGDNDAANTPIQNKYQSPEFLRTIPHLRIRIPFNALLLRLRSQLIADLTSFFAVNKFVQTHPPIITSSDCEGAGEVFTVEANLGGTRENESSDGYRQGDYFGSQKYLTVSSQLHLEALAQSVERVWTLSPTFRAEKSDTTRHLSEFYMLEAEMAFITDPNDIMDIVEELVRELTGKLINSDIGRELLVSKTHTEKEINGSSARPRRSNFDLRRRWRSLIGPSWPRISYKDAISLLQTAVKGGQVSFQKFPHYDGGLQTEHEKFVAEQVGRNGPVFVTDYPKALKPFYMAPSKSTTDPFRSQLTAACFDLLVPDVCEIAGGSIREHCLLKLQKSMKEKGLSSSLTKDVKGDSGSLDWYLDLRRYGSVSHGGFGLGFDRLLAYLSGVSNVRDVVAFPRYHGKCLC